MTEAAYKTIVMSEPQVKILENGKFGFFGKYEQLPDGFEGKTLDYLRAGKCYDLDADVWNGYVSFDDDFSVKERLEQVDEILSIVDRQRLEKDLDEKKYATLMAKGKVPKQFRDYKNKEFIANTDKVIQKLSYEKLKQEQKWDFDVRHFKVQEAVELMLSDDDFKQINDVYWMYGSEIALKLAKQKTFGYTIKDNKIDIIETESSNYSAPVEVASSGFCWLRSGARPYADLYSPLDRYGAGVAALKKC